MTVVGIQFNKIVLEKFNPARGKVSVNNNVVIKDVVKTELSFGKAKQDALRFDFEFKASYEPKIAEIAINGFLTFFDKKETVEALEKEWKKNKKVDKDVMGTVLNSVLSKCNIEALVLSREIGLPPPVPMPKVKLK